ncbi:hypothetical protein DY000_02020633 [Brassica cretica]|uniref:Uncharacterized protein n=1 Tax=Brassica cretica TaxID=69181 RepID=A0ABQ7DZJ7_BRACR|nr:hypothetical protein DY000_02020633 [Brassica cretica]
MFLLTRTSKRHTGTGPRAAHTPSEKEDGWRRRERAHNQRKDLDPRPLPPTEKTLFPRVSKPRRTSKNRTNRSAVMVKPQNGEHISRERDREA